MLRSAAAAGLAPPVALLLLPLLLHAGQSAADNPWDKYNFSPSSRTLQPVAILAGRGFNTTTTAATAAHHDHSRLFAQDGTRDDAARPGGLFPLTLSGEAGAFVVLDFGKNVGGFTTVRFGAVDASARAGGLALAYSESADYAFCPAAAGAVGSDCQSGGGQEGAGDHSNGGKGPDGVLRTGPVAEGLVYSPPPAQMRGGFRYLNLFVPAAGAAASAAANSSARAPGSSITIEAVTVNFTAAPTTAVPSAYANHFYSSDDLLNRIWYGCAYTVQLCSVDPRQGRQWGPPASGWNNGALIGVGGSIVVDGAKRDRTIWPGDLGVSSDAAFATLGDVESSRQSLNTLYGYQHPVTGMMPYVGPEVFCQLPEGPLDKCPAGQGAWHSDTYHLWALVGTGNVFRSTEPAQAKAWMLDDGVWSGYQAGVNCSLGKVGAHGLMVVDQTADWQRHGQGGENIAANALLAHVLETAAGIAADLGDAGLSQVYSAKQVTLVAAINSRLWDEAAGAYIDNPNSTLHPQDGNSLAVWFNVATAERKSRVLANLKQNWGPIGAASPEWIYEGKPAIGTFPGSMEVLAHLSAGAIDDGVDLIKRQWGYMLQSPNSTRSTFWEGFQADGAFAFTGIYMSHAHGWSTGPATALSFYALGLRPAARGGGGGGGGGGTAGGFVVAPQPGTALTWCNGSLALFGGAVGGGEGSGDGSVHVAWEVGAAAAEGPATAAGSTRADLLDTPAAAVAAGPTFTLVVDSTRAPPGSIGRVGLPLRSVFGAAATPRSVRVTARAVGDSGGNSGGDSGGDADADGDADAGVAAATARENDGERFPRGVVREAEVSWEHGRMWYEVTTPARVVWEVVVRERE